MQIRLLKRWQLNFYFQQYQKKKILYNNNNYYNGVFHISKAHIHKFIFIPGTLYRNYPILAERKVGKRNLEKINSQ